METNFINPERPTQYTSVAELEEAVRQHLEMAQRLLKEIKTRRAEEEIKARQDAENDGKNS